MSVETYGDPRLPDRFWSKVAIRLDGCWEWTGATSRGGYGSFRHRYSNLPHRLAYRYLVDEIPEGYEVDHLCKNRVCVNVEHLEAVPPRVNNMRSNSTAALNARKKACKWGHPFSPENTEPWNGGRRCIQCRNDSRLRQTLRRRARIFGEKYPDLVCRGCGEATALTVAVFDLVTTAFCSFCGRQMKGDLTRRPSIDTNTAEECA